MSETEVLERGGRGPWPRRLLLVGALVATTALSAGVAVDRAVRNRADAADAVCAATARARCG